MIHIIYCGKLKKSSTDWLKCKLEPYTIGLNWSTSHINTNDQTYIVCSQYINLTLHIQGGPFKWGLPK